MFWILLTFFQAYQPRYMYSPHGSAAPVTLQVDEDVVDGLDDDAVPAAALDIHSLKAGGIINIGTPGQSILVCSKKRLIVPNQQWRHTIQMTNYKLVNILIDQC